MASLVLVVATAAMGSVASAEETERETGPLGTLVIEDGAGDTLSQQPWLDLRQVWFDAGDDALTITIVLEDLREEQTNDRYEVSFLNDGSTEDELRCTVGGGPTEARGCTYTYVAPDGHEDRQAVASTVDIEADHVRATVPYTQMGDPAGEALEAIRAVAQIGVGPITTSDAPAPTSASARLGHASVTSDSGEAPAPFVVDGDPVSDPSPGDQPLIDDEVGDALVPIAWYDLDALWFASDGTALTVTFQLEDITEDQEAAEYEVWFVNDHEQVDETFLDDPVTVDDPFDPVTVDRVECDIGQVETEQTGCYYHYGPEDSAWVPTEVDHQEETVSATISYELLRASSGDTLEEIDPTVWIDGERAVLSSDGVNQTASYTLT